VQSIKPSDRTRGAPVVLHQIHQPLKTTYQGCLCLGLCPCSGVCQDRLLACSTKFVLPTLCCDSLTTRALCSCCSWRTCVLCSGTARTTPAGSTTRMGPTCCPLPSSCSTQVGRLCVTGVAGLAVWCSRTALCQSGRHRQRPSIQTKMLMCGSTPTASGRGGGRGRGDCVCACVRA